MKKIIMFFIVWHLGFIVSAQKKSLPITWVKTLEGDFSFTKAWQYPINIHRDELGQLIAWYRKGEQPEEYFYADGRLKPDSIEAYYKTIDTAHVHYNMYWESDCYSRKAKSHDFLKAEMNKQHVFLKNSVLVRTNCSFRLKIFADSCELTTVKLDMIPMLDQYFETAGGYLNVEKDLWSEGILKAEFSFTCAHVNFPDDKVNWKGRIYIDLRKDGKKAPVLEPKKE